MPPVPAGRSLAVVAVLSLLVAGAAGATVALPPNSSPDPVANPVPPSLAQPNGTTSYLRVPEDDVRTSGIRRPSVDVTASGRMASDRAEIELAVATFKHRFNDIGSETNRTAAVRRIARTLENKTGVLRQRQETAIERYNRGAITTKEFIGTLARVDAAAQEIDAARETVLRIDDGTIGYSIPPALETRLRNLEAKLLPIRGKLRKNVLRPEITGQQPPRPTYVVTGDRDVVLATIIRGTYVRESFVDDEFALDDNASIRIAPTATDRIRVLYPWATAPRNNKLTRVKGILGNTSTFHMSISHRQGSLQDIYLDGGTTNVFREYQTRDTEEIGQRAVKKTLTNTSVTLQLQANGTHETGPTEVTLTRPGTSNPVNGVVYVDGTRVGRTGSDGTLWVVDTLGATSIRVETEQKVLSVRFAEDALPG